MMRGPKPMPAIMVIRMKPLPRRHRIAHLRALIRQQPARSIRRECCAMKCWRGPAKKLAQCEPANLVVRIAERRAWPAHSDFTT
jgi:hypothetical protein